MALRLTPTRRRPRGSCKRQLDFQNEAGKTLRSKTFFLDLPGCKNIGKLEQEISMRGGKIEKFFHRDVKFLVTNRCLNSSTLSPLSRKSPLESVSSVEPTGSAPVYLTRAAKMLAAAKQKSGSKKPNQDVLSMAKMWGCKIISLDTLRYELQRHSLSRVSAPRGCVRVRGPCGRIHTLTGPFLKVEDQSRLYRPLVYEPPCWPCPQYDTPPNGCPFDIPSRQARRKSPVRVPTGHLMITCQKKPGYCECCSLRYNDITMHLRSSCHQKYASNDRNFVNLDKLISKGTNYNEFVRTLRAKHKSKRPLQGNKRTSQSPWSPRQKSPSPQKMTTPGKSAFTSPLARRPLRPRPVVQFSGHMTSLLGDSRKRRRSPEEGRAAKRGCYGNSHGSPVRPRTR